MEPVEVNAGCFYCRPLRHGSRVDDTLATTQSLTELAPNFVAEFLQNSTAEWENDAAYHFAVAEQTNVEILTLVTVEVTGADHVSITVRPTNNPARVLPNDNQVLAKATIAGDVEATEEALHQWAEGSLGKKVS